MKNHGCPGFKAAGIVCGIKKQKEMDLGLIYSTVPCAVAGVFTTNIIQAAPLIFTRKQIKNGTSQAIIVNSGNANCLNGPNGIKDAEKMADAVGKQLDISMDDVCVTSTGVIGAPLPILKITNAIPPLTEKASEAGFENFAQSIMTTDTFPKIVQEKVLLHGKTITILGIAKGSGMIHPNMATMLGFVCTDLSIPSNELNKLLNQSIQKSFNRITVDGDTSTNDMVIVLANGCSKVQLLTDDDTSVYMEKFDKVLSMLAYQIIKDGEGATKTVTVTVKGAKTKNDAIKIAETIANSKLVKTAFFGEDPNWGRIIAAAGRSGVKFNPDQFDLWFDNVLMAQNGMGMGKDAEAKAASVLAQKEFSTILDLKSGDCEESMLTSDLSVDYVKINADYRS